MSDFGIAKDYNIFSSDAISINEGNIEGCIASNGALVLRNYYIGSNILPLPAFGTDNTIIAMNNNFSYSISLGTNFARNTVVYAPNTNFQTTMTHPNGTIITNKFIDFELVEKYLECCTLTWSSISPNGTVQIIDNKLYLIHLLFGLTILLILALDLMKLMVLIL